MTYDRKWLEAEWVAGLRPEFLMFWGHRTNKDGQIGKSCFSQWFAASFDIDGQSYRTTEHWMMASKARIFGDTPALEAVLKSTTPNEAKSIGRKVRGFDADRWDAEKRTIVTVGNQAKFTQNPRLGAFLRSTGDAIIVEASPLDPIWGIGLSADAPDATNPTKWLGDNLLGFALMDVRDDLR
jgi:conserved hypothetical protein, ribA/ribD-fused